MNQLVNEVERDLLDALQPAGWTETDALEGREAWRATSLGEADWCARKAMEARQKAAALQAEADRQIAAIREWAQQATARPLADAAYFEGQAIDWFDRHRQEQLAAGTKPDRVVKTLELPGGGKVQARQMPEKVTVLDEDAALTWAERHGADHLVRVKKSLALAEIKKHIKDTGELPEGIELEPGDIKLSLSLPEVAP